MPYALGPHLAEILRFSSPPVPKPCLELQPEVPPERLSIRTAVEGRAKPKGEFGNEVALDMMKQSLGTRSIVKLS